MMGHPKSETKETNIMKVLVFVIVAIVGASLSLSVSATNKEQLIEEIAIETGINRKDVKSTIESFFEKIKQHLAQGDQISLVGFGTFAVRERAARTGRNPQTGETIQISASKVPSFKAGKILKDAVNKKTNPED